MDVQIDERDGQVTVTLSGEFSFRDVNEFKNVIAAIDKPGISSCRFNLQALDKIDSAGLGMLVQVHDISQSRGFPVSLTGMQKAVRHVLQVTDMNTLFDFD